MCVLTVGYFLLVRKQVNNHGETQVGSWFFWFSLIWDFSVHFDYLLIITLGGRGDASPPHPPLSPFPPPPPGPTAAAAVAQGGAGAPPKTYSMFAMFTSSDLNQDIYVHIYTFHNTHNHPHGFPPAAGTCFACSGRMFCLWLLAGWLARLFI